MMQVEDFKYLGSWTTGSKRDMEIRIGLIRKALNKLDKIWKSKLKWKRKIQFFRSTIESVLLYGEESWTFSNDLCRRLDAIYTRTLKAVVGFSWRDRKTNSEIYGELNNVMSVLTIRRLIFIGHMWRRKQELVCQMLIFSNVNEKGIVGNKVFWKTAQLSLSDKNILTNKTTLSENKQIIKSELETAEVLKNLLVNLEISKVLDYESLIDHSEDKTLREILKS